MHPYEYLNPVLCRYPLIVTIPTYNMLFRQSLEIRRKHLSNFDYTADIFILKLILACFSLADQKVARG